MSALADRRARETVCPHCGGRLAPDQDWCLECGAGVGTRIRTAPDWRVPLAIVAGVVALVAAGLVVALVALSNSANQSVPTVAASAPTTPAAKSPPATTPATTTTPAATTTTTAPASSAIGAWPAGVTGFTVVLDVVPAKATAAASAAKVAAAGIPVGLLFSTDYSSMRPGDWIVFSGTYTTRAQAATAASQLQAKGQTGAYAFSVVPAAH